MSATVVLLENYGSIRRFPPPPEPALAGPELVLGHFRAGRDRAAELAAQLALHSGSTLVQIYERLRGDIYRDAGRSDADAIVAMELDERLVAFAARLAVAADIRHEPQAMLLSTSRRGVSACLRHLCSAQGVPAGTLDLAFLARHRRDGAGVAGQFPAVRYLVVDGADANTQELRRIGFTLQELRLLEGRMNVVVLGDDPVVLQEAAALNGFEHVCFARTLAEAMAAVGIPAENPLTERERAVLEHVAAGATNQQAATALGISIATVKTYLERAQSKLKSCDRASTVAAALRRGWL